MALPVVPMQRSSLLDDQQNGRLDADILRVKKAGAGTVNLIVPAARSWEAMHAAAARDGIVLGSVSSYRTYAVQVALFTERYTTRYLAGRPYKVWRGQRWYQKPGTAVTAVPGTSNHGWGCAIDVASVTTARLRWLLNNERRFGYSHEVQSERWHVRYWAGDDIPVATKAYEASLKPKPPPEPEDDDVRYIIKGDANPKWYITDGITKRWVDDKAEVGVLVFSGLAKWNNGLPHVWPQDIVNDIEDVTSSGGSMVIRRKLKPTQSLLFVGGKVFVGHDIESNPHVFVDPDATNIVDADEAMWTTIVGTFAGSLIKA